MISIAVLGFGVVGSGVAEVIAMNSEKINKHLGEELKLKYILDLRDFPDSPFCNLVTHNADDVFGDPDVKVVVETIGGARIAYEYTKRALSCGKSVVTSNKELVATHGVELMKIAEENNCLYLYEAAVGGGIPIIRPLHRCLAANRVVRVAGIVNGTTNYILTNMRTAGISYDEALKQAQANGYAEQNPAADVEGVDAQRKLSILSSICLGGLYVAPEEIYTKGITDITLDDINFASKINSGIKLLAVFLNDDSFEKPSVYVAPHYVSKSCMLSSVEDVFNGIIVEGNALGEAMFYGKGAGMLPTASAVVGDILEAALPPEKNASTSNWFVEPNGNRVTSEYEDIVVNILVKTAANKIDALKSAFADYDVEVLLDDADNCAVVVNGIAHKDIDSKVTAVDGVWFHYMA